jgi:hypothetical protein
MLSKIWEIIVWIFGLLFGKKPGPVTGKKVTNVWIMYDDKGRPIKKKVRYDDGTEEELPIDPNDPTDESGFLNNISKPINKP